MPIARRLLPKPWFVWRPSQIGRRLLAKATAPAPGFVPYPVAWGASIVADGRKMIGRSLRTIGTYDLAVTETLFRLLQPGDHAIDAGANVGYMSVLMARAVGPAGRVTSFEPHPDLFGILERNLAGNGVAAWVDAHPAAIGSAAGNADLVIPRDFGNNDGIAHLARAEETDGRKVRVRVECLDDCFPTRGIAVLKLDVEGFEEQVLEGAQRLFADGRVQHVVFEDHLGAGSPVMDRLQAWGYTMFSLGWKLTGLRVVPVERGYATSPFEAPSYLATRDPQQCLATLGARGWRTLRALAIQQEGSAACRPA